MKDNVEFEANFGKFADKKTTAKGENRASVALNNPETLWFNTGTLCNIECVNCYIASSPTNDALVYITTDEVSDYLGQIRTRNWPIREIGFTGGEPYMNPEMNTMTRAALEAGYEVLVLTNAMRPMMRKTVRSGIEKLVSEFGDKITFRVSLDHWSKKNHDQMRGPGSYAKTIEGMSWLKSIGARMAVAGRMLWNETDSEARAGYQAFYSEHGFEIDSQNPGMTVLFPEMDEAVEVPEITSACWTILDKSPAQVMCSSSRMVVKRKGAQRPAVLACTLLPYSREFELGSTLKEAESDVYLNHPHCAKFCVLGGASCSA
ncbi:radical SAM protein [Pseudohalocynthiibacter aestuariivivens]|jgi:sulfatase maturation enzyme AslB (radical SAM superfamily)|uniref:Radical SAM protein n=1 Tax=Pseudohalocynthiibacter aestuariivivens TaxID=1591409 RepID=A0ABV5JG52_9RHOB|nr:MULTISPECIES: radical SAM protein [Pseudohalocynthiibacter]MBS9716228.1 radical SAM protein [Pseudohalocynthiibacter aestuariivivens]MCK0100965.1 radical SAM protein [Pseudohalocynthiibacter sp. F2068]